MKIINRTIILILFSFILSASVLGCKNGKAIDRDKLFSELKGQEDTIIIKTLSTILRPDSMANFLCEAALGKIPNIKMKSFNNNVIYAYNLYPDSLRSTFLQSIDNFADNSNSQDKVALYILAGGNDLKRTGFKFGREIFSRIKNNSEDSLSVFREIIEFQKQLVAENDFNEFYIGFKTASNLEKDIILKEKVLKLIEKNNSEEIISDK